MKKTVSIVLVLALGVILLAGCGNTGKTDGKAAEPSAAAETSLTGSVSTDGSTSMEKVISSLGEAFKEENPEVAFTYNPTGSFNPRSFSSCFSARLERPISQRPSLTAVIPEPEQRKRYFPIQRKRKPRITSPGGSVDILRKHFEEELDNLSKDMIRLGALCEEAILLIITDLREGNKDAYAHMSQYLDDIKQKERAIEGMCIRLLMQQQPVAGDLRRISAALKMVTDMERIGVQCADIAEIITYLNGKACGQCEIIRREAEEAGKMVTGAVNAFVRHDSMLAEEIVKGDDVVDVLFSRVRDALLEMIISKDSDGSDILDLLMISKYFERIADHAVNIAEWVIFAETGVRKSDE